MVIKKERRSVYEETIEKKKKVKIAGSQTVIKIEDHQSETQAKDKVKKKKCVAEEDSDQLNFNKKKKIGSKLKERACSDNSVSIGSSSDCESVKEIKEKSKVLKKKSKKGQDLSLLTLENNQDNDQDLPKPHKTHTQENTVSGVKQEETVAQNSEGGNVVSKRKKKKKKEREISSSALMEDQDNDQEISNKNLKKQNKITLPENVLAAKKHRKNIVQSSDSKKQKKKRKKKKDKHDSLSLAGIQDNNLGISDENLSTREFRKNKETSSQDNLFISEKQRENIVQNSESDRGVTKRKKKKSKDISFSTWEDNQDQSHSVSNKHHPRKKETKLQGKTRAGKKHKENSEDDSEVTKKKKKKTQKEEEDITESVNLVDEGEEVCEGEKSTAIKNNKKRKTKPMEDLVVDIVGDGLYENNNVHCNKKGKKRNKQGSQNSVEEPRLKKKKKVTVKLERTENEAMECEDDVTIVEERKGNCDETNIDKVRRQALQEEIDRESGKTKVFRNKVESDTKFGQWSTATFESSDQKTKFLKLMGGFKKGFASNQNSPATTEKPNMALNRKGEETLKQTLQMEFEKAINFKHHRGVGLGFQPTANKKVHIDKYTSRSVKFDD